jgi:hypothetical protein
MLIAAALVIASVFVILRVPGEMSARDCEEANARA